VLAASEAIVTDSGTTAGAAEHSPAASAAYSRVNFTEAIDCLSYAHAVQQKPLCASRTWSTQAATAAAGSSATSTSEIEQLNPFCFRTAGSVCTELRTDTSTLMLYSSQQQQKYSTSSSSSSSSKGIAVAVLYPSFVLLFFHPRPHAALTDKVTYWPRMHFIAVVCASKQRKLQLLQDCSAVSGCI
jgi:archaellin